MSDKARLRETRAGTVINTTSKRQDATLLNAIFDVCDRLEERYPTLTFHWSKREMLAPLLDDLRRRFPDVSFCQCHKTSFMTPDGGILSLVGKDQKRYPILIAEKKNQGSNDIRAREGKPRQARGNAIERLGKNVIGFRVRMLHETIFPFVCFGDGCDFADELSILDRVRTIAMFGELNQEHLFLEGSQFNRGTFYFRVPEWTQAEMVERCFPIAERSIYYYFSKYGRALFE